MEARFQEKWTPVFRPEAREIKALPGKVDTGFPSGSAPAFAVTVTATVVILTLTAVILGLVPRICSRRRIPGGRRWILATRARMTERDEGANGGALPGKMDTGFPSGSASLLPSRHRHRPPHPHRRHPHPHRRHPRACPEDLQSAPHPRRALVDPRHKGEDDGARRGCDWRRASRKSGYRFSVRKRVKSERWRGFALP